MIFLLLACTGSDADSVQESRQAAIFASACSPTDGLALELTIGVEPDSCAPGVAGQSIWIQFWAYGYPPDVGSYAFDMSAGDGQGFWYADASRSDAITLIHGEVEITDSTDGIFSGTYAVQQEDRAVRSGAFEARGCETTTVCG